MSDKSPGFREQYELALATLEDDATEAFLLAAGKPEQGEIRSTIAVNDTHPDLDASTILQLYAQLGEVIAEQTGADITLEASL